MTATSPELGTLETYFFLSGSPGKSQQVEYKMKEKVSSQLSSRLSAESTGVVGTINECCVCP